MRHFTIGLTLVALLPLGNAAWAGWRERHAAEKAAYAAHPLVAPNGVVTPMWAAKRMENSPVPLYGYSTGRRPWAFPLAQQATASANMARWDQLGYRRWADPRLHQWPAPGQLPHRLHRPHATPERSGSGLWPWVRPRQRLFSERLRVSRQSLYQRQLSA